jgi:hypothetical protein
MHSRRARAAIIGVRLLLAQPDGFLYCIPDPATCPNRWNMCIDPPGKTGASLALADFQPVDIKALFSFVKFLHSTFFSTTYQLRLPFKNASG